MNPLARVERILSIEPHDNADTLSVATVLGFGAIIRTGDFQVGDLICFIFPDTVLPSAPWSEPFLKRGSRVKAIKLRGIWSFGIVLPLKTFDLDGATEGTDIADIIGVTKYEPPAPKDMNAKGALPHGIMKTDEDNCRGIRRIPYGSLVDITLKIDGQSATYFYKNGEIGICSRSLEIKEDGNNNYTSVNSKYGILDKLRQYCEAHKVNLAIRGEIYGANVQGFANNPHAKLPLSFAVFSILNLDTLKYTNPGDEHYFINVAKATDLLTVPIIQTQVVLTPELIEYYAKEITQLNGLPFEGVVAKGKDFSCKIINLDYDSKK